MKGQRAGTAASRELPSGIHSTAVIWHHSLPGDRLGGHVAFASLEVCGAWMPVLSFMQCSLHAIAGCCAFMLCLGTCQVAALHVLSGSCGAHLGAVPSVSHVRWLHAGRAYVQALCPCANGPPAALILQHSQGALICVLLINEWHSLLAPDAEACLSAGLRASDDALKPGGTADTAACPTQQLAARPPFHGEGCCAFMRF